MGNNYNNKVVYMNSCYSCGKALKGEWSFCPFCKAPVEVFNCSSCRREIKSNWKFCPHCTKQVSEASKHAHRVDKGNEWLRNILKSSVLKTR